MILRFRFSSGHVFCCIFIHLLPCFRTVTETETTARIFPKDQPIETKFSIHPAVQPSITKQVRAQIRLNVMERTKIIGIKTISFHSAGLNFF